MSSASDATPSLEERLATLTAEVSRLETMMIRGFTKTKVLRDEGLAALAELIGAAKCSFCDNFDMKKHMVECAECRGYIHEGCEPVRCAKSGCKSRACCKERREGEWICVDHRSS